MSTAGALPGDEWTRSRGRLDGGGGDDRPVRGGTTVHRVRQHSHRRWRCPRGGTSSRFGDSNKLLAAWRDAPLVRHAIRTLRDSTVDRLVAAYRAGSGSALAAAYEGTRRNPVLSDSCHFDALADVTGDASGRDILLTHDDAALVESDDPGVLVDVDPPGELDDP